MFPKNWLRARATVFNDWLRYSPLVIKLNSSRLWLKTWTFNRERRLGRLLVAYRAAQGKCALQSIVRRIRLCSKFDEQPRGEETNRSWPDAAPQLSPLDRTIVLKAPLANGEKGILHVHAEGNWQKLVVDRAAAEYLDERYHLYLNASWSPTNYKVLFKLLSVFRGPLFIQVGNRLESAKLEGFHERIRCVPTLTSDWINPEMYRPVPRDRRAIDIVMVANWAPFKRHWELFRALARLPAELQITLIGQKEGPYTVERVRQQAKDFGAPQQIRFLDNLPVEEVQDHLGNSKISLMLSKHEGASVVAVESMFADTPVGLMREAHIGSKDYINAQTGVLLGPHRLAAQLADFLKNYQRFQPRQWACSNVAASLSLARLNDYLREYSKLNGLPWTTDIVPFCWRPFPTYINREDGLRLAGAVDDLRSRFPKLFGAL
jgi:glycosyltransferase involved in cell wall biosynthesis